MKPLDDFSNPMENKNMIENKNVKPMAVVLGSAVTATLATIHMKVNVVA